MAASSAGADPSPTADLSKQTDSIAQGLGLLYKECSEYDPSGQICDAIGQMIQALGHIEKQIEAIVNGADPNAGGPQMGPDPSQGGYPVAPGQQGPMDQAGSSLAAQLMAAQGQPPTQ
jgi:hypothetical protein